MMEQQFTIVNSSGQLIVHGNLQIGLDDGYVEMPLIIWFALLYDHLFVDVHEKLMFRKGAVRSFVYNNVTGGWNLKQSMETELSYPTSVHNNYRII